MAIIIPSFAPGAISTYADLIDEVRDMMDDAAYDQRVIDRAIRKSEATFNRELRVPEMETRIIITVTGELTTLPDDFLQMRTIFHEGNPDRLLSSMSPAALVRGYGGMAGEACAYAIEGLTLRVAPFGPATLEMSYYAALPQLSDDRVSNWLLRLHPDLYVSGVLYHLARRERDSEGMAMALNEVTQLLESINKAGQRNRWGASPLTPSGMCQVAGARA